MPTHQFAGSRTDYIIATWRLGKKTNELAGHNFCFARISFLYASRPSVGQQFAWFGLRCRRLSEILTFHFKPV